jgi:hypothetical protein
MQAAAELGAAELRGKELPPEQVERRRRTALELGLGKNLVKGYHGPRWTRAQLRLLGKLPDEEVARRTGRSRDAVRGKRGALGIPNPDGNRWSAAEDALVRTFLPPVATARTGRSLKAVYEHDPVIRRGGGAPTSYAQVASWASSQPDSGRQAAQLFLAWATGDEVGLLHLPTELQHLAIITHLAEVGRGYASALDGQLYPLLQAIVAGTKTWGDYRDFSPALKAAEDSKMDWTG